MYSNKSDGAGLLLVKPAGVEDTKFPLVSVGYFFLSLPLFFFY